MNLYQINSSLWSLLRGALRFHTLSLPSSSFQPRSPWPGSLLKTNWTLPFPSFLAAALSDLSLPLTPSTTCCLTRYPAGFSGEIPFFWKVEGIERWVTLLGMQIGVLPFQITFSEMHVLFVPFLATRWKASKRWENLWSNWSTILRKLFVEE